MSKDTMRYQKYYWKNSGYGSLVYRGWIDLGNKGV